MKQEITQIDAFTNKAFSGNPAAVCLLEKPQSEAWMQNLAAEMNLSETVFLIKDSDNFQIRWFTPLHEVELCGHATLASVHYLYSNNIVSPDSKINFTSMSGPLTASKNGEWITLDFPLIDSHQIELLPGLEEALGTKVVNLFRTKLDYIVEIESEQLLQKLSPNFDKLKAVGGRGFLVTTKSSEPYDFKSRCFYPHDGINEDPVTGSAHCALAPYWAKKLNKTNFFAYQASKRGGTLKIEISNDRCFLFGQAVTVFSAELEDSVFLI